MEDLLVGNGTVVTMKSPQELIENGAVLIKGTIIEECGPMADLKARHPGARFIDAGGRLIMPGMTNTHMHLYSTFARGMALKDASPSTFVEILERLWWRLDKTLTIEDIYYSALVPLIDCIKKGTTTIIDHHASPHAIDGSLDELEKALRETGIRGSLCYELSDRDGMEIRDRGIAENVRFVKKCASAGNPMVTGMFGIHAAFTVSDETLKKAREAEAPLGCGFHVHTAEDKADVDYNVKHHGLRVVERFKKHGILGPKSLCIHCVHINEHEMDLLKETDTASVHNPQSNMGNAVGCAPVLEMLKKGILMGMGTDGYTCDMFEAFKVANLLHKIIKGDPRVAWEEPVKMSFQNNQAILSRYFPRPLGVIEKGAFADIILVDYQPPTPLTAANIFGHILFGISSGSVHTTIINGKIVMEGRKLLHIDEELIAARSRELAAKLWERF
ncbi:MAG: putative aminohydrolase SsnA [Candidatus Eremiobacteraeota bacterium]|nr:putative aminohydrolase SsnA [Candidatus Eremiobacteraeota bacterium]